MIDEERKPRPNYLWSMFTLRCPRCRRGDMFRNKNAYRKLNLSYILDMPDCCPVCKQKFEMEPGFWYGTGYVSYGLMILLSAITFIAWWILIGISVDDNRIFYWLILNAALIIISQPYMMRLSRVIYLNFFVHYNENYETEKGVAFDQ